MHPALQHVLFTKPRPSLTYVSYGTGNVTSGTSVTIAGLSLGNSADGYSVVAITYEMASVATISGVTIDGITATELVTVLLREARKFEPQSMPLLV